MIKQPSVYRNPPESGFIGGYNWSAMFFGLLLLVLVNIGATQFVAYRLEYQPALGSPLLRYQLHSIYQPFAWAPRLLRYGSSADPRIRLPLLSGALIVVAGAAVCVETSAAAGRIWACPSRCREPAEFGRLAIERQS
jgi:hypothetical protein